MELAPDFFYSKTTYATLAGVFGNVAVTIYHRPDLVPLITSVFGLLAIMFTRDTVSRKAEEIKAHLSNEGHV